MLRLLGLLLVVGGTVAYVASLDAEDTPKASCPSKCAVAAAGGCPIGQCAGEKCTAGTGACSAGKCSQTACADGKCTTGKCSAGTSTDGKCSTGACATCPSAGTCAASGTADAGCPIAAAMKNLPRMTYQVGDQTVGCPKAAAGLAEKANGVIHYVVAGKTYDTQPAAMLALVESTETFVAAFAEPKKCAETGTVTVAGQKACCPNTAAATSKMVKSAMDKVCMSYAVADKSCSCPNQARKLAEENGKPVEYVVSGQKSGCQLAARLNLARAKYKAAIEETARADAQAVVQGS